MEDLIIELLTPTGDTVCRYGPSMPIVNQRMFYDQIRILNDKHSIDFNSKIKEKSYSIYKSSGGELHAVFPKFSRTSR